MGIRVIFIFILVLFFNNAYSEDKEFLYFKQTNTLKPFLSEIRNPLIKAEVGFLNKLDNSYFVEDFTHRPFVESNLGVIIPLFGYTNKSSHFHFVSGGIIGNNVLVDLFGPPTAAVINTDYFFGIRTGAIKYYDNKYIRNAGFIFVPFFHESAHIGDEFALHGYQTVPDFKRINLSYETWELVAVINDPDTIRSNLLSFKTGVQGLWNIKDGYYFADSLEVQGAYIPDSENIFEFFAQLNYQRTDGFFCSEKWMNIFSLEVRNRARLSYNIDIPEIRTWNYNLYFGWTYNSNRFGKNPGVFLRYYNGVIPHGQFRNTDGFRFVGISLVYY